MVRFLRMGLAGGIPTTETLLFMGTGQRNRVVEINV